MGAARQLEQQGDEGADTVVMPAGQFDPLVATLDEPDPAPALARAVLRTDRAKG